MEAPTIESSDLVPASVGPSGAPSRAEQAVQLRTSLERVLGQHVLLSARLVRLRVAGDPGYVQAALNELARNTQDLTNLITQVYGEQTGPAFVAIWERHETAGIEYTRALVDHDAAGQQRAKDELSAYPARMSAYLGQLTGGALPAAATAAALQRHIDQQLTLADRVVAGDDAGSYQAQREDYNDLFGLAKSIAAGIAAKENGSLPADFDSPQRRLESSLGQLLGEHWELAVDMMQAARVGGRTLDVVGAQVDRNSRDLASAMNVLFGPDTAKRFLDLWADHLDALAAYAQAPDGSDESRAATDQLAAFERGLGALLSTGTMGRLAAPVLTDAFVMHDRMLRSQSDASRRGDYAAAYAADYDGYGHMFQLSATLAAAIGPQLAARLPVGGVHTGGGGLTR